MTEDQIAALDGDWERFPPAEREAFAFARRFTFEPHRLDDASIRGLRAHFSESQCLEMILSMGGNNAINRWKDGIGVPQSADGGGSIGRKEKAPNDPPHTYKTPTAEAYRDRPSGVAALVRDEQGTPTRQTRCDRPALESNQELAERLAEARRRESRFVLESAEATARLTDRKHPEALIPNWMRLLARFPVLGKARITAQLQAEELPQLSETLRGQLGWIVARQDRSWYMLGLAERRLRGAGMTPAQIEKLDTDWAGFSPRERALFRLAKHLAASPVVLTDSEVASAIKEAGNEQVVQCIHYVALLASLGRITEAAGLTLEP